MEFACVEDESGLSNGISIVILEAEYESADFQKLREVERFLIVHLQDSTIGLLIDFGNTNHVGGGFLSSLVRCYQRALSLKRRFVICSLKPWPRNVFTKCVHGHSARFALGHLRHASRSDCRNAGLTRSRVEDLHCECHFASHESPANKWLVEIR